MSGWTVVKYLLVPIVMLLLSVWVREYLEEDKQEIGELKFLDDGKEDKKKKKKKKKE